MKNIYLFKSVDGIVSDLLENIGHLVVLPTLRHIQEFSSKV